MTEHVDEPCSNPQCFDCNPESRPACGPCRTVMVDLPNDAGFQCPGCGSWLTMKGRIG